MLNFIHTRDKSFAFAMKLVSEGGCDKNEGEILRGCKASAKQAQSGSVHENNRILMLSYENRLQSQF